MRFYLSVAVFLSLLVMTSFTSSVLAQVDSPRKQLENGILPENIVCKPGYSLTIFQDGDPACLKPSSVIKLQERDYIKSVVKEFPQKSQVNDSKNIPDSSGATVTGNTGQTRAPNIQNIPASPGSIVNFYVTDDDLNTSPNGVDIIDTQDLLEFTVNGIPIKGPDKMIETGPSTGQFYVKLELPDTIDGRQITQDDIIEIRYLDQSDAGGEHRVTTKSIPLSKTFAQLESAGGGSRIGHDFTVRIYEPDANLDSTDVDNIPLSQFKFESEGGLETTLSNPVFDANAGSMYETGENTGIFEIIIKIPRSISGKTIHIGDWYEISYFDSSTPSNTSEEIKLKGRIG